MRTVILLTCLILAGCTAVTEQTVGVTLLPPPASAVLAAQDGVSLVMDGAVALEQAQPTDHRSFRWCPWTEEFRRMGAPERMAVQRAIDEHPEVCESTTPWYRTALNVVLVPVVLADVAFTAASALAGTLILVATTPFAMLTTCRAEIVRGPPFPEDSHCISDFPVTGWMGRRLLQQMCRSQERLQALQGETVIVNCPWDPGY